MATAPASPRPMPFASSRGPEAPRVRPSDRNASMLIPAHSVTSRRGRQGRGAVAATTRRHRSRRDCSAIAPSSKTHRRVKA
jgi:hypothetical protein